ncbi:alkaline phosphatase family protein [Lacticaseibacillus mingshuiensis]|uniref:Alkaline phosphatase family protein n=1 Tax=Lacticaseibacillus mingshuiensis TaxID=2799574 RepID=A0ABW4CKA4_9LACO
MRKEKTELSDENGTAVTSAGQAYLDAVSTYPFWENTVATALPQKRIGQFVMAFLQAPSADGRRKKVALIGYDGARADALVNILPANAPQSAASTTYFSGHAPSPVCSGISSEVAAGAHVYLTFAGGIRGTATEQETSTAPGWASITTGRWGVDHGMTKSGVAKHISAKTFMLQAAETGLRSAFVASWPDHFHVNYVDEIAYLKAHPAIPMRFIEEADDRGTFAQVRRCLTAGAADECDVVFCTLEGTDHNGHETGFGNTNYRYVDGLRDEDEMAYQLLETIRQRPNRAQEDWLIILTTDHGGLGCNHGGQTVEERTTWLVCNKPVSAGDAPLS